MSTPSPAAARPTLRHLEQLMAQLLDGVILIDPTGVILSANTSALRMHGVAAPADLGATAEDYAGRFSLRSRDGRPLKHRDYPLFRLLAGDSFPDEIVQVAPAGEDQVRWVHQVRDVTMDVDGGDADYLALVICDVSARFDAETRFDAMFRANPAPALIVRLHDLRIARANPGFLALTGFAQEQLSGRPLSALGLLDDAQRRLIEDGDVVPQAEADLGVADGSTRLVLFAGQPIDVTGEDAVLLTFADLEPRRQAEAALVASQRDLLDVFEMAPVAMTVTRDADHVISRVNAAFRQMTGYDAVGDTIASIMLSEDRGSRSTADVDASPKETRIRAQNGDAIDCVVSVETISMDGKSCTLQVWQDVTERRRTEQELAGAIDEVMKDASWLSRSILDKLATLRRPQSQPPAADLSPRERQVLDLICNDLDDPAIAARLGLSRNTVRNHVASIYAKLGVNRRSGAVVWGRERGMGSRET